jgi:long-chain fatty acid transport protein
MYRFLGACVLGVMLGMAAAVPASAQGFGVYEQGACMTGRGGAGVADPCPDGSGIFYNPAALSVNQKVITLGGAFIGPSGTFTDTSGGALNGTVSTLNKHWYPVPNIYVSLPFAKRYAFGLGVMAPYGLTTDWPVTSQGRFLGYKSLVQGVYVQPTFAVKVSDRMSVGIGIDATYLNVELRQRVDLAAQPLGTTGLTFAQVGIPANTDFADIQLKGNSWHAGYHLGVKIDASDRVSLGFRYLSSQKVSISSGTIATTQIMTGYKLPPSLGGLPVDSLVASQFAPGGKLSDQAAETSIPLPSQFVAGVAIKASSSVKLFFDYQFSHWSEFDVLPINGQYLKSSIVESYQDVSGFRAGTDIGLGKSKASTLRLGVNLHPAAAPDQTVTPNLPEGSRREFTAGFGTRLSKSMFLDFAYMYLGQPDRNGRTTSGKVPTAPTAADNNGVYSFGANILNAALSFRF